MKAIAKRALAGSLAATTLVSTSSTALAYSRGGHARIPIQAWETMRAAVGGANLFDTIPGGIDPSLPSPTMPGPCAQGAGTCGRTVTSAEWATFVTEIRRTMMRINTFENHVPLIDTCTNPATRPEFQQLARPQTSLQNLLSWVDFNHFNGMEQSGDVCGAHYSSPPSGAAIKSPLTDRYAPAGIFSYINLGAALEGGQNQGSVLGFYAKLRDDDNEESVLGTEAVAQIVDNAVEAAVTGAVIPFVCVAYLLIGRTDCIAEALRIGDGVDLTKTFDLGLPHIGHLTNESFIGFWHFIDARGRAGVYNDKPGLAYTTAGPDELPGSVDQAIIVATDIAGFRIDGEISTGATRYEVLNPTDGLPASRDRSAREWTLTNIAETEFSPLDNLAYYGADLFTASIPTGIPALEALSWPLHAIGDATVPHHVSITSGHGHVAYEEWVDAHLDDIYFTQRGCKGDCDWLTMNNQYAQVHRVLEHAFRYREHLRTHGIRDLVTLLANETLAEVSGPHVASWPFCDVCDVAYRAHGALDGIGGELDPVLLNAVHTFASTTRSLSAQDPVMVKMVSDPVGYYNDHLDESRKLQERAVGATIAYLIAATAPACKVTDETCGAGAACCAGYVCGANGMCQPQVSPD